MIWVPLLLTILFILVTLLVWAGAYYAYVSTDNEDFLGGAGFVTIVLVIAIGSCMMWLNTETNNAHKLEMRKIELNQASE